MKKNSKMKQEKKTVASLIVGDEIYRITSRTAIKGGNVDVYDYNVIVVRGVIAPDSEMKTRIINPGTDDIQLRVNTFGSSPRIDDVILNKEELQEVITKAYDESLARSKKNLEIAKQELEVIESHKMIFSDPSTYEDDEKKGRNLKAVIHLDYENKA